MTDSFNEIDKLYDQMIVEYPNNFDKLKQKISSMSMFNKYEKLLRNKIINSMSINVVDGVRSAIAMCGDIKNIDNSVIKDAIIKYINSIDIFDTIMLHIIDNSGYDKNWEICGLYDNKIACQIYKLLNIHDMK